MKKGNDFLIYSYEDKFSGCILGTYAFMVNNENWTAYKYARDFAENIDSKSLCIFSKDPLCGRAITHLLYAVSHYVHLYNPELKVILTDGDKFSKEIMDSILRKNLQTIREKYRKCDVLLVDNADLIYSHESAMEEFVLIYNELYESGKRILLTSSVIKEFKNTYARFITRFFYGDYVLLE